MGWGRRYAGYYMHNKQQLNAAAKRSVPQGHGLRRWGCRHYLFSCRPCRSPGPPPPLRAPTAAARFLNFLLLKDTLFHTLQNIKVFLRLGFSLEPLERNPLTNRCHKKGSVPGKKKTAVPRTSSRLKKAATRSRPSVSCELSQLQARRLILKVGLGRHLVPRDLPTAKKPNRLYETLTSMLKALYVKRLEGYEIHLRGIVRPRLPRAEK